MSRPGVDRFTERTPRVVAARRLTRRAGRDAERAFLAEGPQAVREALAAAPCPVRRVFADDAAAERHPDLLDRARELGLPVDLVTERGMAGLSETVTPQGIVVVCDWIDVTLDAALDTAPGSAPDSAAAGPPALVAVLAELRDPGNVGTILRTADAAGAGAVVCAGETADPFSGKCVRATAGSVFHLPLVRGIDPVEAVGRLRSAGLRVLAATGDGPERLDDLAAAGELSGPTAWVFGNEAHGVAPDVLAAADAAVRIPIYGRAESLNVATAAAVCLYASAVAQRGAGRPDRAD